MVERTERRFHIKPKWLATNTHSSGSLSGKSHLLLAYLNRFRGIARWKHRLFRQHRSFAAKCTAVNIIATR
jgi:hypothetical protein